MSTGELFAAVSTTLVVCLLSMIVALPIGTCLSVLLVRTNVFCRGLGWIALGSQLAVPLYAFAGGWSAGIGWQGWLNPAQWLGGTAIAALQQTWTSIVAVGLLHGLAAIPWVALTIALGLYWSNRSLEEMVYLEKGLGQVILRVILPQLRPWLLAASIWCCLPVMTEMVITNLYQVPTVAEQIYLDASRGTVSAWTYIGSFLLFFATLIVAMSAVNTTRVKRTNYDGWGRLRGMRHQTLRLRNWPRGFLSLGVWFTLFLLVGLPMINLLAKAGWQPHVAGSGQVTYGWSIERLVTTLQETGSLFTAEISWSMTLSASASLLAIVVAILLVMLPGEATQRWIAVAMLAMICIPGPLVGMFLIWGLNRETPAFLGYLYDRTLLAPMLAQQCRLLPVAWLLIQTLMASIPERVWELARIDGLSFFQRLRFIIGPHHWVRWLAVLLTLVSLSIGELSCSILVLPPGVTTLAMRLFEMLHFGMRHQDSGLCGLFMLTGWLVSFAMWKTLNDR